MIGNAKINYSKNDLIELIKKDIIQKFGQRDLVGINLSIPEIYNIYTKIIDYPDPEFTIKMPEQIIKEMLDVQLPEVPRQANSISVSTEVSTINVEHILKDKQVIISGTLPEIEGDYILQLKVNFPLGITKVAGNTIPYTVNNYPKVLTLSESNCIDNTILIPIKAIYSSLKLSIVWGEQFLPEKVEIINNVILENNSLKVKPFPTLPEITFNTSNIPEEANSSVRVEVDLSKGIGAEDVVTGFYR